MKQPSKSKNLATTGGLNAGRSVPRRLPAASACAAPLFLTQLLFCMVHERKRDRNMGPAQARTRTSCNLLSGAWWQQWLEESVAKPPKGGKLTWLLLTLRIGIHLS